LKHTKHVVNQIVLGRKETYKPKTKSWEVCIDFSEDIERARIICELKNVLDNIVKEAKKCDVCGGITPELAFTYNEKNIVIKKRSRVENRC